MSEGCKSLIDDYITGILEVADLEDALTGIFGDKIGRASCRERV